MTAPRDFLAAIVARKKETLAARRAYYENLRRGLSTAAYTRYSLFRKTVARAGRVNLIAEIKKASPSKGLIRDDFDPLAIARAYHTAGADALSVLTEEDFFLGKPAYLRRISEEVPLPTLMKDFVIDELQLYEARHCGAAAVLLIAAILDDAELADLLAAAHALDLDCLVEVHDERELDRALAAGAAVIGINNRDLRTFEVSLSTAERLAPRVPKDRVVVAESGITCNEDILRLAAAGAHAVLIGETFMREKDIARKVREVMVSMKLSIKKDAL